MKKILYSLIALLTVGFTACAEFEEPVVENYGKGPAIGVAAVTSDSTITLTMTVDTVNTTYFAFALYEGATETPNAEQLLKATAGGKVAAMLKAADEKWNGVNVKSISFTGLMPNTEYHIYAVASSKFGIIGEIADTLVVTTDGLSPFVVEAEQDSTAFYVTFSEAIATGKGKVSAVYYESWGDFSAATPVDAEDITVAVAGNVAGISLENVPAGALALVSWEAGAFVDAVGNACNALVSGIGATGLVGVYGQMPNATIDVVEENPVNEGPFADWATFVGVVKYPTAIFDLRADVDPETGESLHDVELGSLKVIYSSEGYEATVDVKTWAVRNDSLLFMLPMEPEFGMIVDVIVGANVVRDINGNMNVEFATENAWLRSYGLEIGAVLGKYDVTYLSAGRKAEYTETVLITANPAVENGLFISNLLTAGTVIEATFDGDYATVSIPDWQYLYTSENMGDIYFANISPDPVVFQINPADSSMITTVVDNYSFGYYLADSEQWYDLSAGATIATRSADQDYGMTRELVLGNYTWSYMSAVQGEVVPFAVSIEADPESETGVLLKNVLVKGSVVKGDFNTATGELAFEGTQALFVDETNDYIYAFETYDLTHVVFDVAADGSMKASVSRSPKGMIWGIYVYKASTGDSAGWYDYAVGDVLMQKAAAEDAEEEESEESSEAPAKMRALQNVNLLTEMMPVQDKWGFVEGPARN